METRSTLFVVSNDDAPPRLFTDFWEAKERALSLIKHKASLRRSGFGFTFMIWELEPNSSEPVSRKRFSGCVEIRDKKILIGFTQTEDKS